MQLSAWLAKPPVRDATNAKVAAVIGDVLATFGMERDPEAWLAWGDDPSIRWTVLAPSSAGLVVVHVRVNVPGEGPRASAKLTRWSRVQTGELAVETQGGRRIVTFQVEGLVLKGVDDVADRVGAFAQLLFAMIDGRTPPRPVVSRGARGGAKGAAGKGTARGTAKAGGTMTAGGTAAARARTTAAAGATAKAAGPKAKAAGPKGGVAAAPERGLITTRRSES